MNDKRWYAYVFYQRKRAGAFVIIVRISVAAVRSCIPFVELSYRAYQSNVRGVIQVGEEFFLLSNASMEASHKTFLVEPIVTSLYRGCTGAEVSRWRDGTDSSDTRNDLFAISPASFKTMLPLIE